MVTEWQSGEAKDDSSLLGINSSLNDVNSDTQ